MDALTASDPCIDVFKYLEVSYTCDGKKTLNLTLKTIKMNNIAAMFAYLRL